jgi:hypothetical protein
MSQPLNQSKTELETVIQWRMIAVGGGLAFLLLIVPFVCFVLFGRQGGESTQPAAAPPRAPNYSEIDPALLRSLRPTQSPVYLPEPSKAMPVDDTSAVKTVTPAANSVPDITATVAAAVTTSDAVGHVANPPDDESVVTFKFKRRDLMSEKDLAYRLRTDFREVDLRADKDAAVVLLKAAKNAPPPKGEKNEGQLAPDFQAMLKKRADLRGLPMRMGAECKTEAKKAAKVQDLSRRVRREMADLDRKRLKDISPSVRIRTEKEIAILLSGSETKKYKDLLGIYVQMFQIEGEPIRMELVKLLSGSKGREATELLAKRALFDLSSEVREAAVTALKERPAKEYQQILLDGLRYPWAPVADHAAEALVELNAEGVVPTLVDMLDQPDPCAPVLNKDKKWVAPELVKLNHLRNCLLCHAPSSNRKDPVRGIVPEPGKKLPPVYYESQRGDFVRADITYLRQDFSVLQPVEGATLWPEEQRYDYVVRMTEVTPRLEGNGQEPAWYPQRDSVLFALRLLTGKKGGETRASWKEALAERPAKRLP